MSETRAALRSEVGPSDEELVADLARGEHGALGALYTRYAGRVFQTARHSLGPVAAEEIVQETFLAVWRGAPTFDPSAGPFRPWVLRIAHWRILNELRRRRRHPTTQDEGDSPLLQVPDGEASPEERAWQDERAQVIEAALATLSPKQREAVALAFMGDQTHAQVADSLGVPLGTAKTRIRDGLVRLRRVLMPLAASLVLVVALGVGLWRWLEQQRTLRQNQLAVAVLTSSEAVSIRVGAVTDSVGEMHGTYRVQPGTGVAVFSVSHVAPPAPGARYEARALIGGRWETLGSFERNTVLIAEGPQWATPPTQIQVTLQPSQEVILDWSAPTQP
ncbi:MAG TPA: sigma-70 family RNA polymerase sigma factor [Chloroflexota bacterium]|nr:sigma-70 family RNA polymerase sigma factor [Chloroflexota bacterium]